MVRKSILLSDFDLPPRMEGLNLLRRFFTLKSSEDLEP
jgi:hypothetical protein